MNSKLINSYLAIFTIILFSSVRSNIIYILVLSLAALYFLKQISYQFKSFNYSILEFSLIIWPILRLLIDLNSLNFHPFVALVYLSILILLGRNLTLNSVKNLCYLYLSTGIFFIIIYTLIFFLNFYGCITSEPLYYRFGIARYSSLFGSPGQLGYIVGYLLCLTIFLTTGRLRFFLIFLITLFSVIITSRASLIWCVILPILANFFFQYSRKYLIYTVAVTVTPFLFLYFISPDLVTWILPSVGLSPINEVIKSETIDPHFTTISSRIFFSLISDPYNLIISSTSGFSILLFGAGVAILGIPVGLHARESFSNYYQIHNGVLEVFFAFGLFWSLIISICIYKFFELFIRDHDNLFNNNNFTYCIYCLAIIFLVNGIMGVTYFHIWQVSILAIIINFHLIYKEIK